MKKGSSAVFILSSVGAVLFAIGVCMVLLPEWNAFKEGVVLSTIGLISILSAVILWCKMKGKTFLKFSLKGLCFTVVGVLGTLALGIGMCLCMVCQEMLIGIVVGVIGIFLLLSLVPLAKRLEK